MSVFVFYTFLLIDPERYYVFLSTVCHGKFEYFLRSAFNALFDTNSAWYIINYFLTNKISLQAINFNKMTQT